MPSPTAQEGGAGAYLSWVWVERPQFQCFLHDISERKQVERIKNEFISTASHELRTLLTAIYGALRLVNSGLLGELSPDAKKLDRHFLPKCRVARSSGQQYSGRGKD